MTDAAAWFRVSAGHQAAGNQVPDVERFAAHHGHRIAERYVLSDSAWKNGGGAEYKATLLRALDDAHAGKFSVLIVWALDRIVRDAAQPIAKCGPHWLRKLILGGRPVPARRPPRLSATPTRAHPA